MPTFTYNGDPGRYYPELNGGVVLNPDDVVTCDTDPGDGRFVAVTPPAPPTTPAPAAPAPSPTPAPAVGPTPTPEA